LDGLKISGGFLYSFSSHKINHLQTHSRFVNGRFRFGKLKVAIVGWQTRRRFD
jgi:hypothetical protein